MKTLLSFLTLISASFAQAQIMVDFEDGSLPLDTSISALNFRVDTAFHYSNALFPSRYDSTFGGFWTGGWAVSTMRNDSVGDFSNLTGAVTGGGRFSNTYMVGQNRAYILLPRGAEYAKVYVTNTTYTANVLENGSGFSRAFGVDADGNTGVPDSLVLSVCSYFEGAPTSVWNAYLADYRGPDSTDYILRDWIASDSELPSYTFYQADSISFHMYSSDNGQFGNNTPDFFAIDDLTIMLSLINTRNLAREQALTCWPNPSTGVVHLGEGGKNCDLYIANITGQVVRMIPSYAQGTAINISDLPTGEYFAVSVSAGQRSSATKIIVH